MKMHNLNMNLAASAAAVNSLLMVESGGTTPRTPEILNSLIAMTNPMDGYNFGEEKTPKIRRRTCPNNNHSSGMMMSSDSNSSSSSQMESPIGNNPPSVQHTCSQLIKAGLKLTIEQKRKQYHHHHETSAASESVDDFLDLDTINHKKNNKRLKRSDYCSESEEDKIKQEPHGLTPEDEERRRRRRERNKIAATKCRLKKRERTANLIRESETLETQNIDFKNQLKELRSQERMLLDVLNVHRPQCQQNIGPATKDSIYKLPPVSSVMDSYSTRSDSAGFGSQNIEVYSTSVNNNSGLSNQLNNNFSRPSSTNNNNYNKPPSIVIEDIEEYDDSQQFINLDSVSPYYSGSLCHNNYSSNQNYNNSQGMDNGCMA